MSDPSPLFSVIIPTFNRPEELRGCLETLQHLESRSFTFEVIVVDDGSPCDLRPVVQHFGASLNIQLKRQENAGPGAARNYGVSFARGRYLAFTDDDCRPDPRWLTSFKDTFDVHPDAMLGGRTVNALIENPFASASQLVSDLVYAHYNADPDNARFFASNNMAFPTERFRQCGGFDPTFRVGAEDRELCDHWLSEGRPAKFVTTAVIRHAHDLTLMSFARQHFNYGRGASRYHHVRRTRKTGRMRDDMSFHYRLSAMLRGLLNERSTTQKLQQILLLGLWQFANAAGFFYEEARIRFGRRAPAQSVTRRPSDAADSSGK